MADTAYDAGHLRQAIVVMGALAVIPNNPSRALKYPLDKHLYAQRHLVECCFSKLKQFRRVATRFGAPPGNDAEYFNGSVKDLDWHWTLKQQWERIQRRHIEL